ncbi:MAG: peptidyl-prolyl cis-trans isomerase [Acidobacteria bacterium]|nr:peptidyl-prolyl cis-trans isomerase [Acidobacteriota bacterium]
MLRNFRSVFKSNRTPMAAVMGVVLLGMVAYLAPSQGGTTPDSVVARVYGREVLFRELSELTGRYAEMMRKQFGGQMPAESLHQFAQSQALQELVRARLMDELVERYGVTYTDAEIRSALERRLRAQGPELAGLFDANGHIKPFTELEKAYRIEPLKAYLRQEEANAKKMLQGEKLLRRAALQVPIDEAWVNQEHRIREERVTFESISLKADPSLVQDPGDASLAAFLKQSGSRFEEGPRRVLQVASVDRAAMGDLKVDDAALKQAYEQKKSSLSQPAQVKARHILFQATDEATLAEALKKATALRAKLVKGGDFAKIAEEESQDPSAKGNGGDLGWFSKDRMVPEFSAAAFAMKEGEISQPVKTQFGIHLIKLEGKKAEQITPFEQVKEQLRGELEQSRFETKAKDRLEALRKRAGNGDLASGAKALGIKLEVLAPFSQGETTVPGLPAGSPLLGQAFSLKVGEVGKPVNTGTAWAVARVQQELPVAVPPLADIRAKVLAAWKLEEAKKALVAKVQAQLKGGDLKALGELKAEENIVPKGYAPAASPAIRQALLATAEGQLTPALWTAESQLWIARITKRTAAPALDFEARRKLVAEIQDEEANRRLEAELRHLDAEGRLHAGFSSFWGRFKGIYLNEDLKKPLLGAEE